MSSAPIDLKLVTHVCVKVPCNGPGCLGGRTTVGVEFPQYKEVKRCPVCRGTALLSHDIPLEMFAALVRVTQFTSEGRKP